MKKIILISLIALLFTSCLAVKSKNDCRYNVNDWNENCPEKYQDAEL